MNSNAGFTLIELVITVAILIILAAIAVPNYRNHVIRSNRTDGMATLMRIAAAQEKFYLQNNSYTADLSAAGLNVGNSSDYYTYVVASDDLTSRFTATASPVESQKQDDKCATLSLDNFGNKSARDGDNNDTTSTCWR
ncbi:MAG: type IV pilin protein [Gammaproteobacteria bacterium]|nr:type IV pilin protein [Gammaproteobacteria bacterium]NND60088.1 type IV pilin protein [Gammaproteobacteria bacterium]